MSEVQIGEDPLSEIGFLEFEPPLILAGLQTP